MSNRISPTFSLFAKIYVFKAILVFFVQLWALEMSLYQSFLNIIPVIVIALGFWIVGLMLDREYNSKEFMEMRIKNIERWEKEYDENERDKI